MPEISYEGFESREDFEKFREYLVGYLPGLIEYIVSLSPTQNQLARQVGVNKATMSLWLQGERKPTPENLAKLIEVLVGRVDLMVSNLQTARDHLEMLRDIERRLETGDFEPPGAR